MDWKTTSSILQGLRNQDDAALWARFVDRFRSPVVRFARSVGVSETSAEDVAQETLLAFVQHYRDGRYDRSRGRLSHWLFGIAYRQALAHRRRDGRRESALPDSEVPESLASDLWERHWERSLAQTCVERARTEFDPTIFAAFESIVHAGRTPAETAVELGVSVKAVYNAKHRVVSRIRQIRADLEHAE